VKAKQLIAIVLFVFAAGLFVWWMMEGHHPWTTTQQMVQVKDELFGTTTEQWQKHFTPGLEYFGPAMAVLVGAGIWLLVSARKKRVQ
jgi:hypothetical protein